MFARALYKCRVVLYCIVSKNHAATGGLKNGGRGMEKSLDPLLSNFYYQNDLGYSFIFVSFYCSYHEMEKI